MKRKCLCVLILFCLSCGLSFGQEQNWEALITQVMSLYKEGKYKEAVPIARKCLEMAQKSGDDSRIILSMNNLAMIYKKEGRYSDAEPLFRTAAEKTGKSLGPADRETAAAIDCLAELYYDWKRYPEAEPLYRKVLEIRRKALGPEHPDTVYSLNNLALTLSSEGRHADAEPLYKEVLEVRNKMLGPGHPDTASALASLAALYDVQCRYGDAEPLYLKALEIRKKVLGPEHPMIASTMNSLAGLYRCQGRYAEAEPLYRQALEIRKKVHGPGHPLTASSANNLGALYESEGRYSDAEPLYMQALEIRKEVFGPDHPVTANSLNNLASLYESMGRYADAEPFCIKALEINRKALGPENLETATSIQNLALLYDYQGRYSDAEPLYTQVLAIRMKVLGGNHPSTAISLNNLALLYQSRGRYSEAEPLFSQAREINARIFGLRHPATAININNLALLYHYQGRYSEAEPLFRQALQIRKDVLGPEHPETLQSLNNLAGLCFSQGRYSDAESLYKEALEMRRKVCGPGHPDTAVTMGNLALLYDISHRYAEADSLYRQALEIDRKALGLSHPVTAVSLSNLATLCRQLGKYSEAESLYRQALEIQMKILGPKHPHTAMTMNNLAVLYLHQGRYPDAERLYKEALETRRMFYGSDHPEVALSIANLAALYVLTGKKDEAFRLMQKSLSIDDRAISDVFITSSEKQKMEFIWTVRARYEAFMAMVINDPEKKPEVLTAGLDAVLRRKGIVIEALSRERETLLDNARPEARELYGKLLKASSLLSSLMLSGPGNMTAERYQQELEKAKRDREDIEKKITGLSTKYARSLQAVDCRALSARLPSGSVLVEYVKIRPFNFSEKEEQKKWGRPLLYAFILPSAQDIAPGGSIHPQLVSLGDASAVDQAVAAFRKEMERTRTQWENNILNESEAEKRLAGKGKVLYDLVVSPIKSAAGSSRTLFIAPDGTLNLVPFGALKDETGHYLLENYHINYLSCGKDLLAQKNLPNDGSTIILADPDYEAAAGGNQAAAQKGSHMASRGTARSADLSMLDWKRLPGTRQEAGGIIKSLGAAKSSELMDGKASEEELKRIKSPFRLHIATHGFFVADQDDMEQLNAAMSSGTPAPITTENMLLRSGLVLAGANRLGRQKNPGGSEDGILTALEISGIPLDGTDLVVLSACETGVGEARCGEGVFGLRRVFQLAGARTVVMSLWSVPDEQTREIMVDYYRRLSKGEGKSEALRNAELAAMEARRKEKGAAHPFFWSSFISAGQP